MPLNSLHVMSHIVAPHLQNFFTVCYLWAAWGNCVFSSWQAQGFHPLYVVATWASTSMYCILMAVSEASMYKTCIIALMSPLAGVFLLSPSWTYFNRFLAGVQNPNPNLSHCGMCACKHGEETGQKLQWKWSELSRTVSYRFFFTTFSFFFATFSLSYGGVRCRFFTRMFIFWSFRVRAGISDKKNASNPLLPLMGPDKGRL